MITETVTLSTFQAWLAKVFILIIAYFSPIREVVHVMLIFLFIDTVSGIWASLKQGERLQSKKLRKTVYKFLWYTVAVMIAWMMEKTFALGWTNMANIVGGFICFVEIKSIFENITRITDEPVFMKILKLFRKKGAETISELDEPEKPTENP